MKMFKLCVFSTLLFALTEIGQTDEPNLKPFPAAEEGKARFVIQLPHKERGEEDDFRVELVAGKSIATDGVNQYRITSSLEPKPLEGWGYTYYEVPGQPQVISTLMAGPPGAPQVEKFVSGEPLLIRYNSRIPIVVYAVKDLEIRYRIWTAPPTLKFAEVK